MLAKYLDKNKIGYKTVIVLAGAMALLALSVLRSQAAVRQENLKPLQQTFQNGVTMSLIGVDVGSPNPEAEICIDLPTNQDWLPYASLETAAGKIPAEGVALLSAKDPNTYAGTFRCYRFTFPPQEQAAGGNVKIIVEKIQTTIPEFISDELCNNAREKARAASPNLDFTCVMGSHGGGIQITDKPADWSDEQALGLAYASLVDLVEGPWEFTATP
jgi:hypothetical protein